MVAIGLDASPPRRRRPGGRARLDHAGARLLGAVACPTLLLHGELDAAVPVALAATIADEVPHARLVVIPGGGHRPDIRSPEFVNLLEFLFAAPR